MRRIPATNPPALGALVLGGLSIPGALSFVIGVLFGFGALILGFVGIARADQLEGAGQGTAVAGIITGGLGMALSTAIVLVLAA